MFAVYVGPGVANGKAEFTLSDSGNDCYDVSNTDGINLSLLFEPENLIYYEETTNDILKVSKSACVLRSQGVGEI